MWDAKPDLDADGPLGSLASIAAESNSWLLIQLAIIAPNEVAEHLSQLITETSDDELRDLKAIRRNLVWTLEKLVWHSATFDLAADMLLRLALAENETFSNNATGTWISLFGSMLPATAARPDDRLTYLRRMADDPSADVRRLAVAAADHALDVHSTVMVSGELQGGVVVEPRGTPATWGEHWPVAEPTAPNLEAGLESACWLQTTRHCCIRTSHGAEVCIQGSTCRRLVLHW